MGILSKVHTARAMVRLILFEIVKSLHQYDYQGYVRPDHGRHIWGEEKWARPGYGLYDRALGIMYINGLWDTLNHKS